MLALLGAHYILHLSRIRVKHNNLRSLGNPRHLSGHANREKLTSTS